MTVTADTRVMVTFFDDYAAADKRQQILRLGDLAELIRTTTAGEKENLPWLKLARFGNARSGRGSLRHGTLIAEGGSASVGGPAAAGSASVTSDFEIDDLNGSTLWSMSSFDSLSNPGCGTTCSTILPPQLITSGVLNLAPGELLSGRYRSDSAGSNGLRTIEHLVAWLRFFGTRFCRAPPEIRN